MKTELMISTIRDILLIASYAIVIGVLDSRMNGVSAGWSPVPSRPNAGKI